MARFQRCDLLCVFARLGLLGIQTIDRLRQGDLNTRKMRRDEAAQESGAKRSWDPCTLGNVRDSGY